MREFLLSWGLIILAAAIDVLAVLVIKIRLNLLGAIKFDSFVGTINYCIQVVSTPVTFFATLFLFLSPVLYAFALSRVNLSAAYPLIVAFSSIFLLAFSYIILNETLTTKHIIGVLFILIGIFIIYLK
jgi:multidrug transporter EmrE-like cation transporter|tara:strand:- start:170 stop:553 length:384 start_codon:yes stop_codon:yes gene_type:complete